MKKRVLAVLMSVMMICALAAGCGKGASEGEDKKKEETKTSEEAEGGKSTWGCSVPNVANSYYSTCVSGVEDAVKKLDADASVVISDASGDSQKQLDQLADLIAQKVKAIVLIPIDSNAVLSAISDAEEAGIPVVCIDTPADESTGVVSTVISDNYSAGEIAGKALLEGIGGKGKIATITTTGSDAVNDRKQALYDLMKEYPDVEIVEEDIVQNATTDEALTLMDNILQSHPDVNSVFTTGDVFAIGICSSLKSNGYEAGEVKVTSVDGTKNASELIESGYLLATAAQLPHELGYQGVEKALSYLNGDEVEKTVKLECKEINKDNVSTYEGF